MSRSDMKKNEELNFKIGWTKGIFPFARTGSLERNGSYCWDWKVEVQEYGRGSCASSLVFTKMWLQQHDTKLHKLNACMYLLFGVKYDVQNAKMFIKNNFILKKK